MLSREALMFSATDTNTLTPPHAGQAGGSVQNAHVQNAHEGTSSLDSLAHPGGNVTGMSLMASDVAALRLALLKEAVPAISRVLVLSTVDPIAPLQVKALQEAARSLS